MIKKMAKQEEIREGLYNIIEDRVMTKTLHTGGQIDELITEILKYEASAGCVLKVEGELPEELTNNIGCMGKEAIEEFAGKVLMECGYTHKMEWTTAGDILIGETVYIDESHIDEYPYLAKERVLHEIAHIDTWPLDDRHGELFHRRLAELINRFLAGYTATMPLVREVIQNELET